MYNRYNPTEAVLLEPLDSISFAPALPAEAESTHVTANPYAQPPPPMPMPPMPMYPGMKKGQPRPHYMPISVPGTIPMHAQGQ